MLERLCKIFILVLSFTFFVELRALDCSELFSDMETIRTEFLLSSVEELSFIPSSFERLLYLRQDSDDPNSYIELRKYQGGSDIPYPVVKVRVVINLDGSANDESVIESEALINSSSTVILVMDDSIKSSSIKSVSYLGSSLKILKVREYKGKNLYLLSSDQSITVPDNYAQTQKEVSKIQKLQEFLSLYRIAKGPGFDGQMLEFLYPPVQAVIHIRTEDNQGNFRSIEKFDASNDEVVEQIFYRLMFRFSHGIRVDEKTIKISDDPVVQKERTVVKDEIFKKIFNLYRSSPYFRWFFETGSFEGSLKYREPTSLSKWKKFMNIFIDILNSSAVLNLRINPPEEKSRLNYSGKYQDWSYNWEDFVEGVDDKIEQLIELLNLDYEKIYKKSSNNLESKVLQDKLDQEMKVMFKKIICLFTLSLPSPVNTRGADLELSKRLTDTKNPLWMPDGECTATIVSSNTVITAAHCLDKLVPGDRVFINYGKKGFISSEAYYIHPDYLTRKAYNQSDVAVDIALIRFSDMSFDDITPCEISFEDFPDVGISVMSEGQSSKRKLMILDEPTILPENILAAYKGFTVGSSGDSGSSLFNENSKIVGIFRAHLEGDNLFSSIQYNEEFIRSVVTLDPRVKIKGVNSK